MTKQEQIEEMAEIMLASIQVPDNINSAVKATEVNKAYYLSFLNYATLLYNAGCRIVPKDSVVLKIKEIEDTCNKCHWVTDYKILKYHEEEVIKLCEQEVKQARKETAKEFAEKLRNKYGKSCSEYYPELIELTSIELDELLKEYEVEE